MSNTLEVCLSSTFIEQNIRKTTRMIDEKIAHDDVVSRNSGEETLPGNTIDFQISLQSNLCIVQSNDYFTLKVGNTTSPEHTNMKMFVYDGSATDIFISNPGVDPIKIQFVVSKY